MRRSLVLLSAGLTMLSAGSASAQNKTAQNNAPHNLILFVPDGLRGRIVTPQTAPTMAEIRDKGRQLSRTRIRCSRPSPPPMHPRWPPAICSATPATSATPSIRAIPSRPRTTPLPPFLESDPVLHDADEHFGGDYLNEETILKMARAKGYSTAAIGKLGPTLIFDHNRQDRRERPALDRRRRLDRQQERRAAFG